MGDGVSAGVAAEHIASPMSAEQRDALMALGATLAMGTATEALFWNAGLGLNFWIWDVMMMVSAVLAFGKKQIHAGGWVAMTACLLFGSCVALRASAWSLVFAVPWTLGLCAIVPFLFRHPRTLSDLTRIPLDLLSAWRHVPEAVVGTVTTPVTAAGRANRGPVVRVLKGLVIGVPTSLVFVGLFASDPEFGKGLKDALSFSDRAAGFGFWSLVAAAGYLFMFRLHAREETVVDAKVTVEPYRHQPSVVVVEAEPTPMVTPTTWATVLIPVTAVFAVFVALNVRHIFRGNALVRDPLGPSYSGYLHTGFYQLLFATILSVCLVLAGHRLLRRSGDHGPIPGGAALRAIEATLVTLTTVTLVSCLERLALYEEAYGATYLRLGVAVIMLSVFGVLVLTLIKSQRRRWRGFGGAVTLATMGIALAASAFDADGYIAMRNLDRAAKGHELDVDYLSRLSPDARIALGHPYLLSPDNLALRLELSEAWSMRSDAPRDVRSLRGRSSRASLSEK
jgi:hypothetical protein